MLPSYAAWRPEVRIVIAIFTELAALAPIRRKQPRDKLITTALLLIGLLVMLPASAKADPWCTLWKNQQMCASIEDFQNFAKRICLQAQAKENPTLDESIRLHTDCQAAKDLVYKAELANARRDRAFAAQKELDAMPR
jgi:hypothetical protein